jgi:hypothetical protein
MLTPLASMPPRTRHHGHFAATYAGAHARRILRQAPVTHSLAVHAVPPALIPGGSRSDGQPPSSPCGSTLSLPAETSRASCSLHSIALRSLDGRPAASTRAPRSSCGSTLPQLAERGRPWRTEGRRIEEEARERGLCTRRTHAKAPPAVCRPSIACERHWRTMALREASRARSIHLDPLSAQWTGSVRRPRSADGEPCAGITGRGLRASMHARRDLRPVRACSNTSSSRGLAPRPAMK